MQQRKFPLSNRITLTRSNYKHSSCISHFPHCGAGIRTTEIGTFVSCHDLTVPVDHGGDNVGFHGRGSETDVPEDFTFAVVGECDGGDEGGDEGEVTEEGFGTEVRVAELSLIHI